MNKATKQFAVNILRRGSYRHWGRWKALNAAKIGRNQYFCKQCGIIGPKRHYQLDHIAPVVPISGFDNFDGFIERLYCEPEGFQLLCIPCHKDKTAGENQQRPVGRKSKKKKKKA